MRCYEEKEYQVVEKRHSSITVSIHWSGNRIAESCWRNENLKSPYEHGRISPCGLFSTMLKQADLFRKVWLCISVEVNILHMLNCHYNEMWSFLVAKEKPVDQEGSHQRIAASLKWLRSNNPLYANFYSNYKTSTGAGQGILCCVCPSGARYQ